MATLSTDRCVWCTSRTPELDVFEIEGQSLATCSAECRKKTEDFGAYMKANRLWFFAGLIGLPLVGLVILVLMGKPYGEAIGIGVIFGGMGLTINRFPFVTPQTVQLMGLEKATRFGRVLGLLLFVGGVIAAYVMYTQATAGS